MTTKLSILRFAILLGFAILLLDISTLSAATHYVDVNSAAPSPPYLTWGTAAATIQDAVDASTAGDEIVVTSGIYSSGGRAVYSTMTNRVAVDRVLTVRSVNGPLVTIIQGKQLPGTIFGDGAIRSFI